MMTVCPSALQIARWEAGVVVGDQKREWLLEHSRGCARCASLISEIVAARRSLFPRESITTVTAAAQTVIAAAAQQRVQRSGRWRRFRLLAGLQILAALVTAGFITARLNPSRRAALAPESTADQLPAPNQGQLLLQIFRQRGDVVSPLDGKGAFRSGDRLRFSYSAPATGHLMIFGVDERGDIFPYYGEGSLSSIPVGSDTKELLPGSITLDDRRGRERIFALWAAERIDARQVKVAVARAMAEGGDVTRTATLNLGLQQTSVVLQRP